MIKAILRIGCYKYSGEIGMCTSVNMGNTGCFACTDARLIRQISTANGPFGASLVDQTSLSELHERAGDPGRREPPTGGAWSSGMYTCMSETIPVSIHAVCVVNTPYTTCFRCARQCRQWYEPPRPSSHPNWWNYHFYVNLIHFSVHLTGPHRCRAFVSSPFPLTPHHLPVPPWFPINPFSHHPPTQTTTKYPPTPAISPNASTLQPPPPSHHLIPSYTTYMPHFSKFFAHDT